MFTVKQETDSVHCMWPRVRHVSAFYGLNGLITSVVGYFEDGGDLHFDCSANKNTIYVMNETGATVARYDLGNRQGLTSGPCADDPTAASAANQRLAA